MTTTIRQLIGKLSLLCAASALAATAPARAGPAYGAPQTLDRPGWAQTRLWDVNDGRQVVGTSISADGSISAGFVLNNGSYTDIGPAGALYSGATGITNSGLIVGYYGDGDPAVHAFLYENGVYTEFSVAGADGTLLRHVSSNGRYLTGTWNYATHTHGFAFDRQTQNRTDFNQSSSTIAQGALTRGMVVGSLNNFPTRAFVYNLNNQGDDRGDEHRCRHPTTLSR